MRAQTVQTWIARHIVVRLRLENVCTSYLLFLMVATRKHSLEEAARFSGRHKSQFSKMLQAHSPTASFNLSHPSCACVCGTYPSWLSSHVLGSL
jgi:hypothetical protein